MSGLVVRRPICLTLLVLLVCAGATADAARQAPPPDRPGAAVVPPPPMRQGPGGARVPGEMMDLREIQRWFDAYVSLQAKEALGLSDTQTPAFLARLAALQETRRRDMLARQQALQRLVRLAGRGGASIDEARVREQLKALNDLEDRALANQRRACEAVDQVLDLRQQARFRMFEEQMERRKFEMLARARRGAAARRQPIR